MKHYKLRPTKGGNTLKLEVTAGLAESNLWVNWLIC